MPPPGSAHPILRQSIPCIAPRGLWDHTPPFQLAALAPPALVFPPHPHALTAERPTPHNFRSCPSLTTDLEVFLFLGTYVCLPPTHPSLSPSLPPPLLCCAWHSSTWPPASLQGWEFWEFHNKKRVALRPLHPISSSAPRTLRTRPARCLLPPIVSVAPRPSIRIPRHLPSVVCTHTPPALHGSPPPPLAACCLLMVQAQWSRIAETAPVRER